MFVKMTSPVFIEKGEIRLAIRFKEGLNVVLGKGDFWTRSKFVEWMKEKYKIDFLGLFFRTTMTSFFRIYGEYNLGERHPLKGVQAQNMQKSLDMFVKLFNRYKDINEYTKVLEETKKVDGFPMGQKVPIRI